jgi:predicted esterase
MSRILTVRTSIHGRVVVENAVDTAASRLIVAFHGYAQNAEDILAEVRRIPGAPAWRIASVQALHRFYARGSEKTVGSWLTRQDRELGVSDSVEYVDNAIAAILELETGASSSGTAAVVFVGFSQGASMAYRAARLGRHRASGVVALGGDIPPELAATESEWPPVLIGAGRLDQWYTDAKLNADVAFLRARGVPHEVCRFDGAHEWTDEFRAAAGQFLVRNS